MTWFSITLLMWKYNLGFRLIAASLLFESWGLDLRLFTCILSTCALMSLTFTGKPQLLKRNPCYVLAKNLIIILKSFLECSKIKLGGWIWGFWRETLNILITQDGEITHLIIQQMLSSFCTIGCLVSVYNRLLGKCSRKVRARLEIVFSVMEPELYLARRALINHTLNS